MGAKPNMSESGWRYLRRLSIQEDGGTGRIGLDRKRGNLLNWPQLQTDFPGGSFANLNLLPQGFIVLQGGGNLMGAERNMSESVRGYLRRLSIQEDGGSDRIGLDRKRGDVLNWLELQTDVQAHSFPYLHIF